MTFESFSLRSALGVKRYVRLDKAPFDDSSWDELTAAEIRKKCVSGFEALAQLAGLEPPYYIEVREDDQLITFLDLVSFSELP